ncbi:hypothetical protein BU16DRAFT_543919 [Lophium mytilinum]|uniref:Uncharacterized protein n=1 Tax=Lophium mytilinum TaxID=390894 RepID=A0A6A6QG60_9PEZI|nr:hypothetical protein BU16DRAFT_543919 [Lophium mytilinum]
MLEEEGLSKDCERPAPTGWMHEDLLENLRWPNFNLKDKSARKMSAWGPDLINLVKANSTIVCGNCQAYYHTSCLADLFATKIEETPGRFTRNCEHCVAGPYLLYDGGPEHPQELEDILNEIAIDNVDTLPQKLEIEIKKAVNAGKDLDHLPRVTKTKRTDRRMRMTHDGSQELRQRSGSHGRPLRVTRRRQQRS